MTGQNRQGHHLAGAPSLWALTISEMEEEAQKQVVRELFLKLSMDYGDAFIAQFRGEPKMATAWKRNLYAEIGRISCSAKACYEGYVYCTKEHPSFPPNARQLVEAIKGRAASEKAKPLQLAAPAEVKADPERVNALLKETADILTGKKKKDWGPMNDARAELNRLLRMKGFTEV